MMYVENNVGLFLWCGVVANATNFLVFLASNNYLETATIILLAVFDTNISLNVCDICYSLYCDFERRLPGCDIHKYNTYLP
jgi:hypothetical protein